MSDGADEVERWLAEQTEEVEAAEPTIDDLLTRYRYLEAPVHFEVGDVVTWKPGLRNKHRPEPAQPAVVLAITDEPVFGAAESGSPYFREPLDIQVGLIDEDGDFTAWWLDSRRLAKVDPVVQPQRVNALVERWNDFGPPSNFAPGTLVTWKDGLKNRNFPELNTAGIVVEMADEPMLDPEVATGSTYYRDRLDVLVGYLDSDDDFLWYWSDSRRLRAIEPGEADITIEPNLSDRFVALNTDVRFAPGDLVQFIPGLRNKRRPTDGQAAVVVSHLEEPVFDGQLDSGSPYFREPLDLVIGVIDEDGDFITYWVDSRRFVTAHGR